MPSFFEKLKKGMGLEEPIIEEEIEKPVEKRVVKKPPKESLRLPTGQAKRAKLEKPRKLEIKAIAVEKEKKKEVEEKSETEAKELLLTKESLESTPEVEKPSFTKATEGKEKWFEAEGQLAIDVYQTEQDLVIQSAIAGVQPEDLDIIMERDVITIKGNRKKPCEEEGDYFSQECFWGAFSREVILPAEVDPNRAIATMKEGVLIIRIPKILREKKRKIAVKSN